MNTNTGQINYYDNIQTIPADSIPMAIPPTLKQQRLGKVGRNEKCPCGSGKKFKNCHLKK